MTNVMGNTSRGTFIQEDTTLAKYRLAIHGTDDQEVVAGVSTTVPIIGVTTESANETANDPVDVVMLGVAKLTVLAASTKGDAMTGTTAGKGLTTTTKGNYCVGYLLETTTAANQVAKVMVSPFLYPTIA